MDKKQVTYSSIAGILGALLVLGGQVILDSEDLYYCESRGILMECDRLSSTAKTCYNSIEGNKRCLDIWAKVTRESKLPDIKPFVKPQIPTMRNVKYLCNQKECKEVLK